MSEIITSSLINFIAEKQELIPTTYLEDTDINTKYSPVYTGNLLDGEKWDD